MRKHYNLDEKHIKILQDVKNKKDFKHESDALRYVIDEFDKGNIVAEVIDNLIKTDYNKYLTRLRLATNYTEKNVQLILDGLNTLLFKAGIDDKGSLYYDEPHPTLKNSENRRSQLIAWQKQKIDNNKNNK